MFDLVHKHKLLVQVLLALMVLPFAFWGREASELYLRLMTKG